MPSLDDDLDAILSADFETEAAFTVEGDTICVNGIFTDASDAVVLYGQVQVEAQEPSITCRTDDISDVRVKSSVTVNETTYTVERIQKLGTGFSLVYLKT